MKETIKIGEGNFSTGFQRAKGSLVGSDGEKEEEHSRLMGMSRDGDTENKWLLGDQQIILCGWSTKEG